MVTMLRRLFWIGLLGGAGYSGWLIWQQRQDDDTGVPEWPPLEPPTAATIAANVPTAGSVNGFAAPVVTEPSAATDAGADPAPRWVPPVDGACPDGYPIKANDNSGIYHVPGGRFYDRTVPERCYSDGADAEADGYRAAKS